MLVPEKSQKIKSLRIPIMVVRLLSFLAFFLILFLGIIFVDYWHLMQNLVDNKHIALENKQLREQMQIFQLKINSLGNDVDRMSIFEQKLRTITGLEREKLTKSYFETLQVIQEQNQNIIDDSTSAAAVVIPSSKVTNNPSLDFGPDEMEKKPISNPEKTESGKYQKRKSKPSTKFENSVETPTNESESIKINQPEQEQVVPPVSEEANKSTSLFENNNLKKFISFLTIISPVHATISDSKNKMGEAIIPENISEKIKESSLSQLEFKGPIFENLVAEKRNNDPHFNQLVKTHQQRLLNLYGITDNYKVNELFSTLVERSHEVAKLLAIFDYQFDIIRQANNHLEQKLHELDEYLLDRDSMLNSTPMLMPVNGWITSYFGPRINPYTGHLKMHEGIDVGAPSGAQITSPADGIVLFSGIKPGFGKHVQIDHGYGIETLYAHSEKLHVKTGQRIKRGTLLANVGSTGHSTGPHLHYEVRINGVPVDPFYFILE